MSTTAPELSPAERELIRHLRDLRFGALDIQVHDGRIVQIEKRERQRFDKSLTPSPH
jgi:hypothetical protein